MKYTFKYYQLFGLLLCLVFWMACGSNQSIGSQGRQIDYSSMNTLADALRVQSGLQVVGSSNNIKVTVRGVNSSRSSKSTTFVQGAVSSGPQQRETTVLKDVEPLFIVDEAIVGNTYVDAARSVNVQDVVSIKVLKSFAETNAYGETGKNGVIKITTKLAAANK